MKKKRNRLHSLGHGKRVKESDREIRHRHTNTDRDRDRDRDIFIHKERSVSVCEFELKMLSCDVPREKVEVVLRSIHQYVHMMMLSACLPVCLSV